MHHEHIDKQFVAGVIKSVQPKWDSPIALVPKMNGALPFCVNYRRLKVAAIPDAYALSFMDDFIDSLEEAQGFTDLDDLWLYLQVPIEDGDKD